MLAEWDTLLLEAHEISRLLSMSRSSSETFHNDGASCRQCQNGSADMTFVRIMGQRLLLLLGLWNAIETSYASTGQTK